MKGFIHKIAQMGDLICKDTTEKIIGCAMRIHSYFGSGFPEIIYKRALIIELEKAGFSYKSEISKDIFYCGQFLGKRRLDLIIEGKILIELKALKEVDNSCYTQI